MNIIDELRKSLGNSSNIRNLGVGLDINKLIVLLNNFRVEILQRDQDIRILSSRCTTYKNTLYTIVCDNCVDTDNCDKSCSKFITDNPHWCDEVREKAHEKILKSVENQDNGMEINLNDLY